MFLHALTQNNDSKKLLNHLVFHSLVFFNILGHFSLMCLLFFMETLNSYSLITPGAPPTARELLWKESLSPDIYHITMATRKQIFCGFGKMVALSHFVTSLDMQDEPLKTLPVRSLLDSKEHIPATNAKMGFSSQAPVSYELFPRSLCVVSFFLGWFLTQWIQLIGQAQCLKQPQSQSRIKN